MDKEIKGGTYRRDKLAIKLNCHVTTVDTYISRAEFSHIRRAKGFFEHVTLGDIKRLQTLIDNGKRKKGII